MLLMDVTSPLHVFKDLQKLLAGKFVLFGSPIGSTSVMEKFPWPIFAHDASKTVAHYLTGKIHVESPKLTAFVFNPM